MQEYFSLPEALFPFYRLYTFKDIDTLLDDFWRDIDEILEKNQHE